MSRLHLTSPKVVAEVIDGEAIILDLRGGSYFATDGVGAVAWTAATQGWSAAEIARSASAHFSDNPTAGEAIAALITSFVNANLLEEAEDAGEDATPTTAIEWPANFAIPVLEEHEDLQGMMQIDPIHDTDASGWPAPAPASQ